MKLTAFMKGVPPTDNHSIALQRLESFWEITAGKYGRDFNSATDIRFEANAVCVKIYTDKHYYCIVVSWEPNEAVSEWYLGATSGVRMPNPTEEWNRGNDLADGDFTFKTWENITKDILSSELLNLTDYIDPKEYIGQPEKRRYMMSRMSKIAKKVVGGYMDSWKSGVARNIEQVFGRGGKVDWVYSSYLTFTSGTSNKFHFFAVVKTEGGDYVGGNAYGRIGANAKIIEIARHPMKSMVMNVVQRKEGEKYNKGYNRG